MFSIDLESDSFFFNMTKRYFTTNRRCRILLLDLYQFDGDFYWGVKEIKI